MLQTDEQCFFIYFVKCVSALYIKNKITKVSGQLQFPVLNYSICYKSKAYFYTFPYPSLQCQVAAMLVHSKVVLIKIRSLNGGT